jgi:hypothetical protein
MFKNKADADWRALGGALSLCALTCVSPAMGQSAPESDAKRADTKGAVSSPKAVSPNATVNLLNLFVQKGLLSRQEADALIKQAESEAFVARQAAKDASTKADDAAKTANAAASAAQPPGTKHVTYVPEIVKQQLRDEIKQQVMAKAEKEKWASPGAYPEWASRIHFYGDLRTLYQGSFFPRGNDQGGAANFNAVNTGSPFDNSPGGLLFPTFNVTQDRNQFIFRGRLGMEADLSNGFTAGIRVATGQDNSPVSTNQTLGGNGGNFSKYSLWLDRGYLNYTGFGDDLSIWTGRFANPFWSPTDLVWYQNINFDGFAIQAKHEVVEGLTPFAVAGAAPVFNTAFNAGIDLDTTQQGGLTPTKLPSHDKWLFGGQVGLDAKFNPDYSLRVAAAYYDFTNVQGQISSLCTVNTSADVCDTDLTRPSFAQKGNTYFALRNIQPTAANNFGAGPGLFQFFGLASQFRPLVASGSFDVGVFNPAHIVVDGEYVINTAFDRNFMNTLAQNPTNGIINNRGPSPGTGPDGQLIPGPFNGGNQGWMARVTVGDKEIKHLWDWNVYGGYKYLESDAMIDGFVDSEFGLGGTNLKGYLLGGRLGIGENVWTSLKWMSANNISGNPFAVDIIMLDINARF